MTEEQIQKGYWYWDMKNNWPPESITFYKKYSPRTRLNLNITQLGLKSIDQKKLEKFWCEKLPELETVKNLWFCSRVNQEMFEAACEMINLEGLYIKWSSIKNIDSIFKLKNLKHLYIGSSSQIEDIRVFSKINWLCTLSLEQLNKVSNFTEISGMTELKGLGINGSIWTAQKIDSLKPLGKLTNLKYLTLINTRPKDKSFDPILNLQELVRFDSSWNYPKSEFEKLKSLPRIRYGNIYAFWNKKNVR